MIQPLRCSFLMIVSLPLWAMGQEGSSRKSLPDVSITIKGDLVLPVSLSNPLFNSATETIGQIGGCIQQPIWKGLGIGAGANFSWWTIKQRALAPYIVSGEIRRSLYYGKLAYERYTGPRTFYELNLRVGTAAYTYDCDGCAEATKPQPYWALGAGWYIHATDNLAFGLTMGYETSASRFNAPDLGLGSFPGRPETEEAKPYQNLLFGLGFSTRLRKSERDVRGW